MELTLSVCFSLIQPQSYLSLWRAMKIWILFHAAIFSEDILQDASFKCKIWVHKQGGRGVGELVPAEDIDLAYHIQIYILLITTSLFLNNNLFTCICNRENEASLAVLPDLLMELDGMDEVGQTNILIPCI